MIKSLKVLQHHLASSDNQLAILEDQREHKHTSFKDKVAGLGMFPLQATGVEIFQVNVGKMCNQVCKHCHVDAGPDRKEIMTRETMQLCLNVLQNDSIKIVDLTGGAPELNPDFRWFVEEIRKLGKHIIVRCNLTIILANKRFHDLPEFFKLHQIEVVSSLPSFTQDRTDRQRGDGVFEDSIKALQMLNKVGYGQRGTGLILNLVYNPAGAFLPPAQDALEKEYKFELMKQFGIVFNNLFAITNMPISRYLDYLLSTGNYDKYMEKLIAAFNPAAVKNVMCRNTISVGWDGYLYDCDFNQMLDLKVTPESSQHLDCVGKKWVPVQTIDTRSTSFTAVPVLETKISTTEDCVMQYQGNLFGISFQSVLNNLHYASAAIVSFARGLNDTPKLVSLLLITSLFKIPVYIGVLAFVMAVGGLLNARKVAATMSKKISKFNHGQGFTANFIIGALVIAASKFGLPVSTTHVSVGSIYGIGIVNKTANHKEISKIALSWVLTLPIAALLSAFFYFILRQYS